MQRYIIIKIYSHIFKLLGEVKEIVFIIILFN